MVLRVGKHSRKCPDGTFIEQCSLFWFNGRHSETLILCSLTVITPIERAAALVTPLLDLAFVLVTAALQLKGHRFQPQG